MPNSLNASGRLVNERISLTHVLGCEAVSGQRGREGWGGGGDVALNSLLMASLISLKLSLSGRALKQLETAKLRVSF